MRLCAAAASLAGFVGPSSSSSSFVRAAHVSIQHHGLSSDTTPRVDPWPRSSSAMAFGCTDAMTISGSAFTDSRTSLRSSACTVFSSTLPSSFVPGRPPLFHNCCHDLRGQSSTTYMITDAGAEHNDEDQRHQSLRQFQHRDRRQQRSAHIESTMPSRIPSPATSRRGMFENLIGSVGLAGLMVVGTSGILVGELPGGSSAAIAEDEEGTKNGVEEYVSSDGTFALRFPAGFKGFSKPLKTHKVEVNFKSEEVKGYEIGVAVDPVRIESLEKFGSPEEVGARVLKVEQGKDGTLDTKLFNASAEKQGDLSLYTLDYFVESTRGFKHFVAKVTIKDNLLYACTGQAKEKDFSAVEDELKRMVQSFRVPA